MRMPVGGWAGPGIWFLTRHADVETVLRDPRFSVDRMRAPFIRDNLERLPAFIQQGAQTMRSMLVMDPPDHTRVRKLVNKAFTPRRIAALRGRIEAIVDELLAPVGTHMDVIDALAAPLPAIVIAELLGVPVEDHRRFKAWAADIVAGIGQPLGGRQVAAAAMQQLYGYLSEIIAARRAAPCDDLISAMVQAQEEDDALSDAEMLATSNLLLIAGHETTTNLIGNGLLALLREPAELERLRGDLTLLPTAIEELLRYDGPVQATLRVAREDVEIGGQAIEADRCCWSASAPPTTIPTCSSIRSAGRRARSQPAPRVRLRRAFLPGALARLEGEVRCAPCSSASRGWRWRPRHRRIAPTRCCAA
jgi:cytochrome P450